MQQFCSALVKEMGGKGPSCIFIVTISLSSLHRLHECGGEGTQGSMGRLLIVSLDPRARTLRTLATTDDSLLTNEAKANKEHTDMTST